MSQEKEDFLARWSRLKQEQAKEEARPPVEKKKEEPMPVLPAVEDLKPGSDFKPFMDPRVNLETRRSALKKLFADEHFKIPDPFEPYSIDLTKEDPIPAEMLKTLQHARRLLSDEKEPVIEQAKEATGESATDKPLPEAKDVPGKQDA